MPACLGASGSVRARQEDVVGELGLGRPHLLAVDHPFVAVELGPRLQRGQVAARVGLGEPLAPGDGSVEDAGDELLLLLLAGPLQDGRSHQRVAEEVGPQRRLRPGELLVQDHRLHQREALAPVLLRPGGADPPAGEQFLRPLPVEGPLLVPGHGEARRAPALGEVVLQPGADLGPEGLCLDGIAEVHAVETTPLPVGVPVVRG